MTDEAIKLAKRILRSKGTAVLSPKQQLELAHAVLESQYREVIVQKLDIPGLMGEAKR